MTVGASADLGRRFLHVNLNCASLDATESLYGARLGLSARMRTDPAVATNGDILGIDRETYCQTSFLYDSRGGRGGCALEAIEFYSPALEKHAGGDPTSPGIHSALMTVADLRATATTLWDNGFIVGDPVDGLISRTKSVLVTDPDGVVVELAEHSSDKPGPLFSGIRVGTINAGATGKFLTAIGFDELEAPATVDVTGDQLAPGGTAEPVGCVVARYGLAEDSHRFSLLVVEHPESRERVPVPWGGNRQGLYRCALRVENTERAMAQVPNDVQVMGDPVWCPLPGTKIGGLHVSFLRSPDGVVFEFVERPLSHFGASTART